MVLSVGLFCSGFLVLLIMGTNGGFLLVRDFSGVVSQPSVSGCHNTLFLSSTHL